MCLAREEDQDFFDRFERVIQNVLFSSYNSLGKQPVPKRADFEAEKELNIPPSCITH